MQQHIPNLLTAARLVLAAVFFGMLSWWQYTQPGDNPLYPTGHYNPLWLNIAFIIYLIALITDFFDGYLARRWKVEGAFGRVTDPFVDKVLVLGSFIFFAGKNFTIPNYDPAEIPNYVQTISGVTPWMVVLILARELLVTSLRGLAESSGRDFGAAFSGKLKMVLQSITILVILVYVNYRPWLLSHELEPAARWLRNGFIWATLVVTIASSVVYVRRAVELFKNK